MDTSTHTLVIRDYPQFRLIARNRRERDVVTEEEAFALYEANWRHVDQDQLDVRERAMIEPLAQQYGKGVMNA